MLKRFSTIAAIVLSLTACASRPAAAQTITNGGFETGTLSGWQSLTQGSGDWLVYDRLQDGLTPGIPGGRGGFLPPQGTYAVEVQHTGPSVSFLWQDFLVPAGSHRLSVKAFYRSDAALISAPHLSAISGPNQQFRIDLVTPSEPGSGAFFSPSDPLHTLFATSTGGPTTMAPADFHADLTPFAGQTVRLRVAAVDTESFLFAGIDDVRITETDTSAVPEPGALALFLPALGVVALLRRRRSVDPAVE